ncbi:DUF2911 domain-containing protein [candidate division KSB1 bacterium]|nr:DUF2911 domain-containing protein [candidate division KSB1 bacterium]
MKQFGMFIVFTLVLTLTMQLSSASAQQNQVRKSLKASVMQRLGVDTDITIVYSRPGVKGRTIWGDLVPWGMAEGTQYSDNKPFPWRAGANEATSIEVSKDVLVEGQKLPAGKYTIHMLPGKDEWVVIFNKNTELWGSYKYNEAEDALRVTVKPVEAPFDEWLTYGFDDLNGTSATAFLHWEKVKVPFKISLPE